MTDPFRPAAPRFPRERLLRAGIDEAGVDALSARFDGQSVRQRTELVRFVNSHTDRAIAGRYGTLDGDGDGQADVPTREQLDDLLVAELRDRLAARNLPVSGVKAELVDRLLASYETAPEQTDEQRTALTGDAEQPQTAAPAEAAEPTPAPAATDESTATSTPAAPAGGSTDTAGGTTS